MVDVVTRDKNLVFKIGKHEELVSPEVASATLPLPSSGLN
jgi:hypothetical protein